VVGANSASRGQDAHAIHLTGPGPFRVVVQKGRSFQRANPHVPVRVDRGRYLVVELPPSTPLHQESSFTVAEPDMAVGFDVERPMPRSARADIVEVLDTVTDADLRQRVETLAALPTRHSLLPRLEAALSIAAGWLTTTPAEAPQSRRLRKP
jgi:hypothetical protein